MAQPQKIKKVPERQCLGCNAHKPKRELMRVVRKPDGQVELDFVGKVSGRGAYLCRDIKCFRKARKSRRIEANLSITIPEEIYDAMEREIEESRDE